MDKIVWKNLPDRTTPVVDTNLNAMQTNAETAINAVETGANTNLANATKGYQTTTEAEAHELTDSAGVKGKIDVTNGKTEQATYTGKNLFNKNGNLIADNRLNTSGGATSAEGQYISEYIPITSGLSYTKNSPTEDVYHRICFYSSNEVSGFISASNSNTNTAPENATYVRFCGMIEELDTTQFEQSSSATSYEPYVGGEPSPSPSYPQNIKNVGDNVQLLNLADNTYTGNGITAVVKDGKITLNGTASATSFLRIPCAMTLKAGETYTLSANNNKTIEGNNTIRLNYQNQKFDTYFYNKNSATTLTLTEDYSPTELVIRTDTGKSYTNFEVAPRFIKSVENLPHTPYNCGSIDIKTENKNKFAGWSRNISTNTNTGIRTNSNNYLSSDFIYIQPNTQYRMSGIVVGSYGKNKFISYYKADKTYISRSNSSNVSSISFTTPAEARYCTLALNSSFSDAQTMENFISDSSQIQLEKGNTTTSYEENKQQIITFPLAEGQVLHEGDYLAEDGIHSNSTTITFNGTENWQKSSKTTVNRYYINQVINTIDNAQTVDLVSNYFKCITPAQSDSDGIGMAKFNYRGIMINFALSDTDFDTLEEFKQWLVARNTAGNPLKVEYKLAEEIVIPYTAEQQEAYYQLQHAQMYEGYTDIECIDEMKPETKVSYLYNNDINNTFGSIIDKLEERVHDLENS